MFSSAFCFNYCCKCAPIFTAEIAATVLQPIASRCCELSSSCPSLTKNSCIFCWFSYARISHTRSALSLTHTNTHPHVPHTIVCGGCLEPRVGGIVCVLLCVSGAVLVRYDNHAHEGAQTCLVILCATGHCVNTIYFSAGLRDVHRILISMCVVAGSVLEGT